ncbi:8-amino-7-oxononanoate synthase [Plasmopara halstedii]|uniref:8-amino-7-oxononanoate synthase n=1 Tax=Plasmopara halstedii TaxID=4781 RepID=A0A0P1AZ40_PLAHL|nr:8-amino-7-oxononanoate synthase [Plasmopara halstedii]CEG46564.1 8-amino-7-oxononanoate synthase [Plasmopara halstedii]|eukprot:XP_024582933.1 8-amino-7-oxononanoate synthase [Plasmopara halstedii]
MTRVDDKLRRALARRSAIGTLRTLPILDDGAQSIVDFYSNDYLGFARSQQLKELIEARQIELHSQNSGMLGATGSRLISGNSPLFMETEKKLAKFYNSEATLLFNSGYAANEGVMSCLPQAEDVIIYDELVHNSCHEGIRLSRAYANDRSFAFRHNDLEDLERKLLNYSSSNGNDADRSCMFVIVEALYSMDGDFAPLDAMASLCDKLGAFLIVDEAHSTGVYGPHGSGVVRELGLDVKYPDVFVCRIHTFGKAMGCHGAVVCGSQVLIDYLVNYARSFIYTTAMPFHQLVSVIGSHELCTTPIAATLRCYVIDLVHYFKQTIRRTRNIPSDALLDSDSPIQSVVFVGNHRVLKASQQMNAMGIRVIPIRSPTVPKGAERFRIVIHAHNTRQEVDRLVNALSIMFDSFRNSKL